MNVSDRRALKWGLHLIVWAVVLLRLVPWGVREGGSAFEMDALQREQVGRARDQLAALPVLEDSAAALTKALVDKAGGLLAGTTESAAVSDLSALVRDRAWQSHTRMKNLVPLPDSTTAGQLRRLSMLAEFEGDVRSLTLLLDMLAHEPQFVVPDRIKIVARDPLGGNPGSEVLDFEIRLAAWYLAGRK